MTLRVLDLFSGIGGFSLGLERAGMKTVAFCEIDPFCSKVLAKHWPGVPCYDDIRTLTAARLATDGIIEAVADTASVRCNGFAAVSRSNGQSENERWMPESSRRNIDLICGGFPCQDISVAGKGAGIDGTRSGLWSEYARIIGEVRPQYVIVENVAALLGRGLARVLRDLASLGFDAEWHCIPASAVGAPHRRDRVWIVANAARDVLSKQEACWAERKRVGQCGQSSDVADSTSACADRFTSRTNASYAMPGNGGFDISDSWRFTSERYGPIIRSISKSDWWLVEPDVGRVANGIPSRVDRLRSLGNAVVPQIPELIGRAILEVHP